MPELDAPVPGSIGDTIWRVIQALRADERLVNQLLGGDARRIERAMPQDAADEPIMVAVESPGDSGTWRGGYAEQRHLIQVSAVAESGWYNDSQWGFGDILDLATDVLKDGLDDGVYPAGVAGGSTTQQMDDGRYVAMRSYRLRRYV